MFSLSNISSLNSIISYRWVQFSKIQGQSAVNSKKKNYINELNKKKITSFWIPTGSFIVFDEVAGALLLPLAIGSLKGAKKIHSFYSNGLLAVFGGGSGSEKFSFGVCGGDRAQFSRDS